MKKNEAEVLIATIRSFIEGARDVRDVAIVGPPSMARKGNREAPPMPAPADTGEDLELPSTAGGK